MQVDHVDFHVDKTVTAQAATVAGVGVDVSFDVVYDPSSVGDCRSQVTLTSPVAGDYVFPLRATGTLPKPQACPSHSASSLASLNHGRGHCIDRGLVPKARKLRRRRCRGLGLGGGIPRPQYERGLGDSAHPRKYCTFFIVNGTFCCILERAFTGQTTLRSIKCKSQTVA